MKKFKIPLEMKVLNNIDGNTNITKIARMVNTTYSHIHDEIIPLLEELHCIKTEKKGRTRIVKITEKGERVRAAWRDFIFELKTDVVE